MLFLLFEFRKFKKTCIYFFDFFDFFELRKFKKNKNLLTFSERELRARHSASFFGIHSLVLFFEYIYSLVLRFYFEYIDYYWEPSFSLLGFSLFFYFVLFEIQNIQTMFVLAIF